MAKCQVCMRSSQSGNKVSHSKRHTRRRWYVNVQRATIYEGGRPRRVVVCTRCLRSHYKALLRG